MGYPHHLDKCRMSPYPKLRFPPTYPRSSGSKANFSFLKRRIGMLGSQPYCRTMATTSSCVLPAVRVGAGLRAFPAQACGTRWSCPAVPVAMGFGTSALRARIVKSSSILSSGSESRKAFQILAKASSEGESEPSQAVLEALKGLQEAWDKVDDKLALGGLGFSALLVLWASTGLIGAIDKLPVIPGFFEFVGILFSGWFVYRYLLFKPDREELLKLIEEAKSKITGQ